MRIYHGSIERIEKPLYGKGKPYNDYGLGFYCTQSIELAKEWSCGEAHDGYANEYELCVEDLHILNLNTPEYGILHWLTLLLKNRTFRLTNPVAKDAKAYLLSHFQVETEAYDVIIGYRADDSYFSFAEDFLNNAISVQKLEKAMRLGDLGEQIMVRSKKAFLNLQFIQAEEARREKYYVLKRKRDKEAREAYLYGERNVGYDADELFMIDILRQGVTADDPRLR